MIVDGSQSLNEKNLEEFAEAADINISIYSYIELCEAGVAIGWAIYEYVNFNETIYDLVKTFKSQKDMDIYINQELAGGI